MDTKVSKSVVESKHYDILSQSPGKDWIKIHFNLSELEMQKRLKFERTMLKPNSTIKLRVDEVTVTRRTIIER